MRLRRALSEPEEPTELNLIPLIDVIMFLLIFFISTTSFIEDKGVKVDKPAAGGADKSDKQSIVFMISSDGRIAYNGREVGLNAVLPTVRRECAQESLPVVIQAHENAPNRVMIQVLDAAKMGGAKDVSVASDKG